ncbi:MAG: Gfo/Idh/MocA family oxidoreductase [Firmicutes bacterium]|nr:Gfo/Idh/MocA family oxidoreductase [Bacillota bacterium]
MKKVRIGVIGLGNMGFNHAKYIFKGTVPGGELSAVCDINQSRLELAKEEFGDKVRRFDNTDLFFANAPVDAVLIATAHYTHPEFAIKAFQHGLHVLIEKPAGVYTKQVKEMNEAAEKSGKVFGIMYNNRTNPLYQKVRDLLLNGELGEIKRTNWIITTWYRTQNYYNSGGWRGTWEGEGGGVLLNQAPHQLDLWQWICGMPVKVRGFCHFGKYHDIEVEDDVTAYVEYKNGATGVFITSTGEAPGTDRLEITGDRGKIVVEDNKIIFWRLRYSERQYNADFKGMFGSPECWKCEIPVSGSTTGHVGITSNWVNSILNGTPLLAPGVEGINGLEISNAIYLSTWMDDWVEIPVDEDLFYKKLQERIQASIK